MAGVDSGIKLDKDAVDTISGLEKDKYGWIILQIAKPEGEKLEKVTIRDKRTVEECKEEAASVTLKGDETATWYSFRTNLVKYDIAYGACYVDYKTKDDRDTSKLIFITWNSDSGKMKDKMKYASTKVVNKFKIGPTKVQASEADDITYAEIVVGKLGGKSS